MGREIRRVPPNWNHPKDARGHYRPLVDESLADAQAKWDKEAEAFLSSDAAKEWSLEEYHGPRPTNRRYYRPAWDAKKQTAYQVYETVSEGTPVSPVFDTEDELINWLVNDGSGMGIGGERQRMSWEAAERFVKSAWAPSMVFAPSTGLQSGLAIHEKPMQE